MIKKLLFPHTKVRDIQDQLLIKVDEVIKERNNLIAHAPTGLGKTAATIGPALSNALKKNLTIFFLTSRHTQHKIAIDTLREIKTKHKTKFLAADIIGKRWLCLQPGAHTLRTGDFNEYCKALINDESCEFFKNLKQKEKYSQRTRAALKELHNINPASTEDIIRTGKKYGICPYELSMIIARKANIIITDYYYVFHPKIKDIFLKKSGKELEECVIIVDEAHNLPNRVKDLSTERLSNIMINRAIAEAKKYRQKEIQNILEKLKEVIEAYAKNVENEKYVQKEDFIKRVEKIKNYEEIVADLTFTSNLIREEQQLSYVGSVALFLEAWKGEDEGFTRILSKHKGLREEIIILSYRCLDPAVITKEIVNNAYSVILMSGTLTPTTMFKEVLGFENAEEETYESPFPEKNKLSIIIPKTSTKFTGRNETQYKQIAEVLNKVINIIPGNSAVFFPSYDLRDNIYKYLERECEKTIFKEKPSMTKQEKLEFLERFKKYKRAGATLLGVASGSFGEGIDLPGDYLKSVIVVGLPLQKPDLETKSLIDYYDKKFGKGWDYGYLFPAFNKVLQSAGRCIRSETDKGVVVFLDERYTWPNYFRCFPKDWNIKITLLYEKMIEGFFN
jgi:DNA excision repair protein ERCC-2